MARKLSPPMVFAVVCWAMVATACVDGSAVRPTSTPSTGATPSTASTVVKVAYIQDGTVPEALELVASAQLAIRLRIVDAIERGQLPAGSDVVGFDTKGDPNEALTMAREIAAAPAFVAVVEAPFWQAPKLARKALLEAGLPVLSLTGLGEPPAEGVWRRLVAPLGREAAVAVDLLLRRRRVCVLGDETAFSSEMGLALNGALARSRSIRVTLIDAASPAQAAAAISQETCRAVAWTGGSTDGAALRLALDDRGSSRLPLLVFDLGKTGAFLESTIDAEGRTSAMCACVDVSTSVDSEAAALLHDFQASFGLELGPFGVEGADAGALIAAAAISDPSRAGVAAAISGLTRYQGLFGTYRFDRAGERAEAPLFIYRASGARWVSSIGS